MQKKSLDPIGKLMGLRYKSHPWHGIEIGETAPDVLTCFVEMVPTDTVKYEVDICILTEKEITHGDILVQALPIGGFRMIDGNEADDKIIAVLKGDAVYGEYKDLNDCPQAVIDRLKHYFLTYKDMPGEERHRCEITHIYKKKEALDLIDRSIKDYRNYVEKILFE